jgi:hypothetical protein
MGYDLHITRKENWHDEDGPAISFEEWRRLASDDPEMDRMHLDSSGNIVAKNPHTRIVIKMHQLAQKLGAKVQGDEGELYDANGGQVGASRSGTIYWPGFAPLAAIVVIALTGAAFWFLGPQMTVVLMAIPVTILVLSGFMFLLVSLIHRATRGLAKSRSKKRLIVIGSLFLSAFALSPCHANLGDTLEKCSARYGQPLPGKDLPDPSGVGDVLLTFQSRGYRIRIILMTGYVAGESFSKSNGGAISDEEKKIILQNDAQGWAWAHQTSAPGENWLRTDGAVASYIPTARAIVLETAPYLAAVKARQAATLPPG